MSTNNRERCLTALMAVPNQDLLETVSALPEDWMIRPTALPQAGLGMLKLRESAMGEVFYLGEFPMAQCQVSITTPQGQVAEGGAVVMDDCVERVECLAICDAVLNQHLCGWESVMALVEKGECLRRKIEADRKAILAHTRVDFSLLDDVGEGQDD